MAFTRPVEISSRPVMLRIFIYALRGNEYPDLVKACNLAISFFRTTFSVESA